MITVATCSVIMDASNRTHRYLTRPANGACRARKLVLHIHPSATAKRPEMLGHCLAETLPNKILLIVCSEDSFCWHGYAVPAELRHCGRAGLDCGGRAPTQSDRPRRRPANPGARKRNWRPSALALRSNRAADGGGSVDTRARARASRTGARFRSIAVNDIPSGELRLGAVQSAKSGLLPEIYR